MWKRFLSLFKSKPAPFLSLPLEIWLIIFNFCPVSELLSCWTLSKYFHYQIFKSDLFWELRMRYWNKQHQELFSFFTPCFHHCCSNFEKCLLVDMAVNSSVVLQKSCKRDNSVDARSTFIGGEMYNRFYLQQQVFFPFKDVGSIYLKANCCPISAMTSSQEVLYHSKTFCLICFSYEVTGRFVMIQQVAYHYKVVIVVFDVYDPSNLLEKENSTWNWRGDIGQGMDLVNAAKSYHIPFILLVGYKSEQSKTILQPTVNLQQVAQLCREMGILFYNIEPEQLHNSYSVYIYKKHQLVSLQSIIRSLSMYAVKMKKQNRISKNNS